jgi:two-component system chemotaxis sensor kinase CheA
VARSNWTANPGRGLQVDIRLPLTLAIIDGFLVGVGKAKFVLPLGSVVEVIEAGGQHVRVDATGRHCVELRGAVLPVVRLRSLYNVESSLPDRTSVVVVNSPRGKYGIEVEVSAGSAADRDQTAGTFVQDLARYFRLQHSGQRRGGSDS